ncbi:hypothetical protein [Planococcus sp. CAU13]|uniref:hypothetical protein n=1 Tax=Planococcus sp. CAU13 TaxID=1541197 RepID=UPI00137688F5|nr:hypothetical protein [Planococcus sp. CAU13]
MDMLLAVFLCIVLTFNLYVLIEKKAAQREKLLLYYLTAVVLFVLSMISGN